MPGPPKYLVNRPSSVTTLRIRTGAGSPSMENGWSSSISTASRIASAEPSTSGCRLRPWIPWNQWHPGQIQHRRGQVRGGDQGVAAPRRVRLPRDADGKRHPGHGFVVDEVLEHQPVVAEHVPVVGGEDDDGVLGPARVLQRLQDPADLRVHEFDQPVLGRGRARYWSSETAKAIVASLFGVPRSAIILRMCSGESLWSCSNPLGRSMASGS